MLRVSGSSFKIIVRDHGQSDRRGRVMRMRRRRRWRWREGVAGEKGRIGEEEEGVGGIESADGRLTWLTNLNIVS